METLFNILVLLVFVSICAFGENPLRASESACGRIGEYSGVVCITETSFKISASDSNTYACPSGTVCANRPEICISDGEPDCKLARFCGVCHPNATSTCLATKVYAACIDGQPDINRKNCQASRPYCSMPYDNDGVPYVSCTNIIEHTCKEEPTPSPCPPPTNPVPTKPPLEIDDCAQYGKFPVLSDLTCRRYYYCYNDSGNMAKSEFVCPYETLFNPIKGKCVLGGNFKCIPNQVN